jgi:transposase
LLSYRFQDYQAVISLATGWTAEQIAEILQLDSNTVRNYFKRYKQGGIDLLVQVDYHGSDCQLDAGQLARLDVHLQEHLYLTAKAIAHWVEKRLFVSYTESGMTALLHRLGYVYKKPKLIPGKANADAQKEFLKGYEKLKEIKEKGNYLRSGNVLKNINIAHFCQDKFSYDLNYL